MSFLLNLLDGTRDIGTIKTGFELRTGRIINLSDLELLISQLDEGLLLENENFLQAYQNAIDDYRATPVRPPILAGSCYPEDTEVLKDNIQKCLEHLVKFHEPRNHDWYGSLLPTVTKRQRQNRRQS